MQVSDLMKALTAEYERTHFQITSTAFSYRSSGPVGSVELLSEGASGGVGTGTIEDVVSIRSPSFVALLRFSVELFLAADICGRERSLGVTVSENFDLAFFFELESGVTVSPTADAEATPISS